MNKQVKDVMSKTMISVQVQDSVTQVAKLMQTHNIGIIPVMENQKVVGVITDRDLVLRVLADQKATNTIAKDVMSTPIRSVEASEPVEQAAQSMGKEKIRRLIVLDHGVFCGLISIGDLAVRHEADQAAGMALRSISEKDVKQ